jgi:hypothetical protein
MKRFVYSLFFSVTAVALISLTLHFSGFTENFSSSLFQRRGIDTLFTLWTKGFLGTFFNVEFFGIIPCFSFLILLYVITIFKSLEKSENSFLFVMVFMVFIIGCGGYQNFRYGFSLLPLHIILFVYFLTYHVNKEVILNIRNKVFKVKKKALTNIILVVLLIFTLSEIYEVKSQLKNTVLNSYNFYLSSFGIGSLKETKTKDLGIFFKNMNNYLELNPGKVLVVNQPSFFYYTDKPGILYRTFPETVKKSAENLNNQLKNQKVKYIFVSTYHLKVVGKYSTLKTLLTDKEKILSYQHYALFESKKGCM